MSRIHGTCTERQKGLLYASTPLGQSENCLLFAVCSLLRIDSTSWAGQTIKALYQWQTAMRFVILCVRDCLFELLENFVAGTDSNFM